MKVTKYNPETGNGKATISIQVSIDANMIEAAINDLMFQYSVDDRIYTYRNNITKKQVEDSLKREISNVGLLSAFSDSSLHSYCNQENINPTPKFEEIKMISKKLYPDFYIDYRK